ncbi:hypothetical protein D3C78_1386740 [compost metagenome]
MCAQTGFQPQAGKLARVEYGRDVAHVGQGVIQRAEQGAALRLQLVRRAPLQPAGLKFGCSQQLADFVVKFTAQALALVLLDFEQAIGKFGRAQGNGACPVAQVPADAQHRHHVHGHHSGSHRLAGQIQHQVGDDRGQAQKRGRPAHQGGPGTPVRECLEACEHRK